MGMVASLRQLRVAATALATALLLCQSSSALPDGAREAPAAKREAAGPAPSVWVTVDASGAARTVTPVVATAAGSPTATVSAPPGRLTETAAYTLSLSGQAASTRTGTPPVASAAGPAGQGAFLACDVYVAAYAPFCQPEAGSTLRTGGSYYVTWSSSAFVDDTTVQLQVEYASGGSGVENFTAVPASRGYAVWSIPADLLGGRGPVAAGLYLAYDGERRTGPSVTVAAGDRTRRGGASAVAIAVPVVVVVVVVLAVCVAGALWWRRRRRSLSQRVGGSDKQWAGAEIQLADREGQPAAGEGRVAGHNVFREELRRQRDTGGQ